MKNFSYDYELRTVTIGSKWKRKDAKKLAEVIYKHKQYSSLVNFTEHSKDQLDHIKKTSKNILEFVHTHAVHTNKRGDRMTYIATFHPFYYTKLENSLLRKIFIFLVIGITTWFINTLLMWIF